MERTTQFKRPTERYEMRGVSFIALAIVYTNRNTHTPRHRIVDLDCFYSSSLWPSSIYLLFFRLSHTHTHTYTNIHVIVGALLSRLEFFSCCPLYMCLDFWWNKLKWQKKWWTDDEKRWKIKPKRSVCVYFALYILNFSILYSQLVAKNISWLLLMEEGNFVFCCNHQHESIYNVYEGKCNIWFLNDIYFIFFSFFRHFLPNIYHIKSQFIGISSYSVYCIPISIYCKLVKLYVFSFTLSQSLILLINFIVFFFGDF